MSYTQDSTEADIMTKVLTGSVRRATATRELAELGIENASSADVEWWLSFTPRQRRQATLAWLILNASYS